MKPLQYDAGDSFIVKAPLIDNDTGEEIPNTSISDVWVQIGGEGTIIEKTLSDPEVTVVTGYVLINLSPTQTVNLEGYYDVYVKVQTTSDEFITIVKDETVKFEVTPLSDSY